MIATNSQLSQLDQETARRQVLAKIYKLLLSSAEKVESNTTILDVAAGMSEKNDETASVKEGLPGR